MYCRRVSDPQRSRAGHQPGAQTSVFMRGANSGHTLVLVDGVRVNNAFNSAPGPF